MSRKNMRHQSMLCKGKRGSATLEFIMVIPFVILMCLVVWQFAVAGLAIVETQSVLKDAVREAASQNDPEKAEERTRERLNQSSHHFELQSVDIKVKEEQVTANSKIKIYFVFLDGAGFSYRNSASAPVIQ